MSATSDSSDMCVSAWFKTVPALDSFRNDPFSFSTHESARVRVSLGFCCLKRVLLDCTLSGPFESLTCSGRGAISGKSLVRSEISCWLWMMLISSLGSPNSS